MSYPPQEPPPYQPPQQPPNQPPYQQPGYPPQQPPYAGAPPGAAYPGGPYQQKPGKRRPSGWWFLPGVMAIVVATAAGVWAVVLIIQLFDTDAIVRSDSQRQTYAMESGERMLFVDSGVTPPRCMVSGPDGQSMVAPKPVFSDETLGDNEHTWVPFAEFTVVGGSVDVECSSEIVVDVRIGPSLNDDAFLPIGFAIIGAIALGLLGFVALLVVAILFFTRPSRKVTG